MKNYSYKNLFAKSKHSNIFYCCHLTSLMPPQFSRAILLFLDISFFNSHMKKEIGRNNDTTLADDLGGIMTPIASNFTSALNCIENKNMYAS